MLSISEQNIRAKRQQAIFQCIQQNNVIDVHRLLITYNYVTELSKTDGNGSNALHLASRLRSIEMAKLILAYRVIDVNEPENKSIGGYAPVHYACLLNNTELLRLLISECCDVNKKASGELGETPLHICCKNNRVECASVLLEHGADPNISDAFGHNPSFWAFGRRHFDMMKILNLPNPKTATALEHLALIGGNMNNLSYKTGTGKSKKGGKGGKGDKSDKGKKGKKGKKK